MVQGISNEIPVSHQMLDHKPVTSWSLKIQGISASLSYLLPYEYALSSYDLIMTMMIRVIAMSTKLKNSYHE